MRQPSLCAAGANQCSSERRKIRLGADAAEQHDLAARLEDAGEFVERGFRIRNGGDDVLRHDHVEGCVREIEMLRIHHPKPLDVFQPELIHAPLRLAQHRLGDATNAVSSPLVIGVRIETVPARGK